MRVLGVVDAYTRECLALDVDTRFASRRVTRVRTLRRRAGERRARHQEAGEITLQQCCIRCVTVQNLLKGLFLHLCETTSVGGLRGIVEEINSHLPRTRGLARRM